MPRRVLSKEHRHRIARHVICSFAIFYLVTGVFNLARGTTQNTSGGLLLLGLGALFLTLGLLRSAAALWTALYLLLVVGLLTQAQADLLEIFGIIQVVIVMTTMNRQGWFLRHGITKITVVATLLVVAVTLSTFRPPSNYSDRSIWSLLNVIAVVITLLYQWFWTQRYPYMVAVETLHRERAFSRGFSRRDAAREIRNIAEDLARAREEPPDQEPTNR